MSVGNKVRLLVLAGLLILPARWVPAQYSAVTTRFNTLNDSFFERTGGGFGFGFGFDFRGGSTLPGDDSGPSGSFGLLPTGMPTADGSIPFRQGSSGAALPPFGGHDPAADATLGFGLRGSAGTAYFNFAGSQGSNRSFVSQSPTVVVPNGGQGFISDTTQTPFVVGLVPVVGAFSGRPSTVSPLFDRIQRLHAQSRSAGARRPGQAARGSGGHGNSNSRPRAGGRNAAPKSTAEHGDLSVAEIRRRQAHQETDKDEDLLQWLERGRGAEAAGKVSVAKIYYRMAANRATGELKQKLLKKLRELDAPQP